jgi:glucose/arabinose dehydrogenase
MRTPSPLVSLAALAVAAGCASKLPVPQGSPAPGSTQPQMLDPERGRKLPQAIAPKVFPRVPRAEAAAAEVPPGYRVDVVVRDLEYPTSVEFDDRGNLYIAEGGFAYGDPVGPARVLRVAPDGAMAMVADQLRGPVTDLLWHDGHLYISHLGTISRIENGRVRDLVTDLPATWDHQNNQLTVGPDGKIYFGMGSATNSGVVGLDNISPFLWMLFYPDLHDVPPFELALNDVTYTTPDALTVLANQGKLVSFGAAVQQLVSASKPLLVKTGAFQPFGKSAERVAGNVKSNGTILRMNADGSGLEVYAWGLRNPFGVMWSPNGELIAADNGYDERGSRPIANAPDVIWRVKRGGFYGFPDFVAGRPVTDPEFRSSRGPEPKMLLKEHPPVEQPLATRPPHAGVTKIAFSTNPDFGFAGQMFLGEVGSGAPIGAPGNVQTGYQVLRMDLASGQAATFFRAKPDALGPKGYEHAVTRGPRRPVDVCFSRDGRAMYVADFGALVAFPAGAGVLGHPFPGSGVIWRVSREQAAAGMQGAAASPSGPPADLSPLPPHDMAE